MSSALLEGRLSALEDKVFGDLDKTEQYPKATDVILGFNNRLGNVLGDYERAVMIMKRLDELESYLDPLQGQHLLATPSSLAEELLSTEGQIRQLAEQLEHMQQLAPLLDSEHVKGAGDLRGRLEAVSERHLVQTQRLARLQAKRQQAFRSYHQVVSTLSDSLLDADRRVALREAVSRK